MLGQSILEVSMQHLILMKICKSPGHLKCDALSPAGQHSMSVLPTFVAAGTAVCLWDRAALETCGKHRRRTPHGCDDLIISL